MMENTLMYTRYKFRTKANNYCMVTLVTVQVRLTSILFRIIGGQKTKSKMLAGIIGVNLSKICLISYNSYT